MSIDKVYSINAVCRLLGAKQVNIPAEIRLSSFSSDHRNIKANSLFIAVKGHAHDGNKYINQAFAMGATCVVSDNESAVNGFPALIVDNARLALSALSDLFAGNPSRSLKVIGITGTNGKTTTNWIIYHILNQLGIKCLRLGTLGAECPGVLSESGNLTTPDAQSIHNLMRECLNAGARACVMEVSSHALDQLRVEHIEFDVGVFTNLTHDHLDYHKDMQHYFKSKRHLFDLLERGSKHAHAVLNLDDTYANNLSREVNLSKLCFGSAEDSQVRIIEFKQSASCAVVRFRMQKEYEIHTQLIGRHNAENLLAAFCACSSIGLNAEDILGAMQKLPQVPGRLERIADSNINVFVDYAHTPDALERVLTTLKQVTTNKLWVVFGCGGDRDKLKRPEMGKVCARLADRIVVTSDNPRTEDAQSIIADILSAQFEPAFVEQDRAKAIARTLAEASVNDVILIAGKGHEDYQIIGTQKLHFSDKEEVQKYIEAHA